MNNSTCNGNIEVDKTVNTLNINSSTVGSIDFQSSSINTFNANSLTILRYFNGTPAPKSPLTAEEMRTAR